MFKPLKLVIMTIIQKIIVSLFALIMSIVLFSSFSDLSDNSKKELREQEAQLAHYKDSLKQSAGSWHVGQYIDDFGDQTDIPYMRVQVSHGANFSNSSVNKAKLHGEVFVEKDKAYIRLFEYNRSQKAIFDYTNPRLSIRSEGEDEVIAGDGTAGGEYVIRGIQFEKFRAFIADKDNIQAVIKTDFGATYRFDFLSRGFMTVWPEVQ